MFYKYRTTIAIIFGAGFSFLLSSFLKPIPRVQKLELGIQDSLVRLKTSNASPNNEILLFKIEEKELKDPKIEDDRAFYANLIKKLIKKGAAGIIINPPYYWHPEDSWKKKNQVDPYLPIQ